MMGKMGLETLRVASRTTTMPKSPTARSSVLGIPARSSMGP